MSNVNDDFFSLTEAEKEAYLKKNSYPSERLKLVLDQLANAEYEVDEVDCTEAIKSAA